MVGTADVVRLVVGPSCYVDPAPQDLALCVALGQAGAMARTQRLATLPKLLCIFTA